MKYKDRETNFVNYFYGNISDFLTKFFVKLPLTPNQLSIIGFILGILSAYFFIQGDYISLVIAVILLQFSILFDFIDGRIARAKSMSTKYGQFLEVVTDHIEYPLIIGAVTYGVYIINNSLEILLLGFTLLIILTMIQNINAFFNWNVNKIEKEKINREEEIKGHSSIRAFSKKLWHEFGLSSTFVYSVLSIFAILNKLHLFLIMMVSYGVPYFLLTLYLAGKRVSLIDKLQDDNK